MAGKKKKSLANRLAKMSDEERARYLQQKAEVEEEAKQRKEQLIATFMKNKIKREDAFSRLNLAKINQQWHKILRIRKCKEMKEDVMHMKNYIERVLAYKNRTIDNLLEELELAEEQYSHNFQAHVTHIDQIIDSHNDYLRSVREQYDNDLRYMIETTTNEKEDLMKRAEAEKVYLQTVVHGVKMIREKNFKDNYDSYMKRNAEIVSTCQMKLEELRKSREAITSAIWRQIASAIRGYVEQTDSKRLHLAELKRLDADSAVEIADNQERIVKQEEEEKILNSHYELLAVRRKKQITSLEEAIKNLSESLLKSKQQLKAEIEFDAKQLTFLSTNSSLAVKFLEKLHEKGEQIVYLMKICQKFETEREQTTRFLPICIFNVEETSISHQIDDTADVVKSSEEKNLESATSSAASRPKTTVLHSTPTKQQIETIRNNFISSKSLPSTSTCLVSSSTSPSDVVDRTIESLQSMENFWRIYNKVEVDYKELKEEKKMLQQQNKQLRGMMRAVLEAANLSKSTSNSKVSTRVGSQNRSAYSAPARRILF